MAEDARKATDDVNLLLFDGMMQACRKMRTLFDNRTREMGLTLSRARALAHLSSSDVQSQKELADILSIEGPTLVRLLDGMERQGLVARREQGSDRRVKHVVLTQKGVVAAREMSVVYARISKEMLADISPGRLTETLAVVDALSVRLDLLLGNGKELTKD